MKILHLNIYFENMQIYTIFELDFSSLFSNIIALSVKNSFPKLSQLFNCTVDWYGELKLILEP